MKTLISTALGTFFSLSAIAADEALLVPDVTPATTTEFGFAKFLEEQVLVKLEGVGFLVLNDEVLNQTARDEMLICAEEPDCPHKTLGTVPARVALVLRVEKAGTQYNVDVKLYQRDVREPLAETTFSATLSSYVQVSQDIAEFANDQVGQLSDPSSALRSMAYQLINGAETGQPVWIDADVTACEGIYTTDSLLEDLMRAEEALLYSDREGGFRAARQIEEGLLCYREVMTGSTAKQLYARVFRAIGAGLHMGGQEQQATTWMVAAVQMDPQFEYGLEDMSEGHPVWSVFRTLRALPIGEPQVYEGTILGPGTHYVDGVQIQEPIAHEGQKHLYQRVIDDVVQTKIMDGNRFPEDAVEYIGLVEAEKVKKAGGKKNRKVATDSEIQEIRGVSMVTKEKNPLSVTGHATVRLGFGTGAVDRTSHLRNSMDGAQWFQEGPRMSTRARFEGYLGAELGGFFELGLMGGIQLAQHEVQATVSGSQPGVYDVSASDTSMRVHGYVQPRVQFNVGAKKFRPYGLVGIDARFVEDSGLLTETFTFAEVPSALLLGVASGAGGRIQLADGWVAMVEASWIGHLGVRAGAVEQGTTPLDRPNPENALRQTIGLVGGIDVSF